VDRTRRLIAFWNWLPAFRAVAETEHLPTASEMLRVSPSALSRTIRLLEDALDEVLFERRGRSLILTDAGRELLVSVRRAMRILDDGVERLAGARFRGALKVACPGPFASIYVLPALEILRASHPDLVPELNAVGSEAANAALLAGDLDVALLDDPIPAPYLVIEPLAKISYGVYCGRTHPLFEVSAPSVGEICEHLFAGPPFGDDHWPSEIDRKIGARLGQLQLGVDFCLTGTYLAVFPDVIVKSLVTEGRLRRLPFQEFESNHLHAVYREPLACPTKIDVLLPILRDVVANV
jgi:DNA-binding transcriptional LysR family regulator